MRKSGNERWKRDVNSQFRFDYGHRLFENMPIDIADIEEYTKDVVNSSPTPQERNLKEGATGDDVIIVQDKLKVLGYFPGSVTGSFGPETTEAVQSFQRDQNIPVTGIVNAQTWDLLLQQTQPITPTNILEKPVLRLGSTGEDVKELQRQLQQLMYYNGAIDGIFGTELQVAVKAFQTNNQLTADGIVGKDTWNALIYLYSPLANCEGETPTPPGGSTYIVKPGDTLYSIANQFQTTVEHIKELNNLTGDIIYVGQELIVPTIPPEPSLYIVQKGDTLYAIANRFHTTVEELRELNHLTSDFLYIGQELKIPSSMEETFLYTVQQGDTLYAIANRFGTTVEKIKELNHLNHNTLSIGQRLIIPK